MFLNVELPRLKAPSVSKTFCRTSLGSQHSSSSFVLHLCGLFLSADHLLLCQVTLGTGAARSALRALDPCSCHLCHLMCGSATRCGGFVPTGGARCCLPGPARCPGNSLHLISLGMTRHRPGLQAGWWTLLRHCQCSFGPLK